MAIQLVQEVESLQTALTGCPDPTQGSAAIVPAIEGARVCRAFVLSDGSTFDLSSLSGVSTPTADPSTTTAATSNWLLVSGSWNDAGVWDDAETWNDGGVPSTTTSGSSPTTSAPASTTTQPLAYQHHVLIANAVCAGFAAEEVELTISEPATNGVACFAIPKKLAAAPGIYHVEWRFRNESGDVAAFERSLLSIEPTLSQRQAHKRPLGPITIGEIRMRLRDFPSLNEYWNEYEFNDAEIIRAIVDPVQAYNEMIPFTKTYSPETFPFHYQWLEAVTARLLILGGTWYLREERDVKYADGKVDSNRGKGRTMIQLGESMWQRYREFCHQQKVKQFWSGGEYSFGGHIL